MYALYDETVLALVLLSFNMLGFLLLVGGASLFFTNIRKDNSVAQIRMRKGWSLMVASGLLIGLMGMIGAILSALGIL